MVLKARDYVLLKAFNGEEALSIIGKEHPDLILMDIQLPGISGIEVTRKLRENPDFNHIPVIALTAYAMKGDRGRIIESGFDAYLSKTVSTRELPMLITEMLSRRQQ